MTTKIMDEVLGSLVNPDGALLMLRGKRIVEANGKHGNVHEIRLYAAMAHRDTTEGRGGMYPTMYFLREEDAREHVSAPSYYAKHGVFGTPLGESGVRLMVLTICDGPGPLVEEEREQRRNEALAKLTDDEKKLLGLM